MAQAAARISQCACAGDLNLLGHTPQESELRQVTGAQGEQTGSEALNTFIFSKISQKTH